MSQATAVADPIPFEPAPSNGRHDGWTAEKQRGFIATLAATGCVTTAAEAVRMSARSAYDLRLRPGAEAFLSAWEQALTLASSHLVAIAFDRAVNGITETVERDGKIVTRHRHSDKLLMFLLAHLQAGRFGVFTGTTPQRAEKQTGEAAKALSGSLAAIGEPPRLEHTEAPRDPFQARSSRSL